MNADTTTKELARRLSLPLLVFYGVGTILGAGIYVLIGKVAAAAGSFAPAAFMMSALIVSFSAYSYAKLSSRFPFSAGESVYVREAFGSERLASAVGWAIILTGVVSAATISRGFAGYLDLFVSLPHNVSITLVVFTLTFIACRGVLEAVGVAVLITLIELVGIALVLGIGARSSTEDALQTFVPGLEWQAWRGIFIGAFLAFYAYIGFEDMVNMAEEVKSPQTNMPWGIGLALTVTTLLYILVAVVAVSALPLEVLSQSEAPFAAIIEANSDIPVWVIGLISLVAISNGALVQIIMGARVLFGMARRKLAHDLFSHLHPRLRTPVPATLVVGAAVLIFALWLPIVSLAKLTSTIMLLVFALVNAALLAVEWQTRSSGKACLRLAALAIPALGLTLCLLFLLIQVV